MTFPDAKPPEWCPLAGKPLGSAAFVLSCTLASSAVLFALLTWLNFNGLIVPQVGAAKRFIQERSVTNTFWIVCFLHFGARYALQAVRFGLVDTLDTSEYGALTTVDLLLHGLFVFFLGWALDHQLKYRSGQRPAEEYYIDRRAQGSVAASVLCSTGTVLFLFVGFYAAVTVLTTTSSPQWMLDLHTAAAVCQVAPVVYLAYAVCTNRGAEVQNQGPWLTTKLVLAAALALTVPNLIPLHQWIKFCGGDWCVFKYLSAYDGVMAVQLGALILFFSFVTREFNRNKEQEMYNFFQQYQDRVDFRRAY